MNTYSTRTGDRIVLSTVDRPEDDTVHHEDITIRLEPGVARPGTDILGELVSESDQTTNFINEIL